MTLEELKIFVILGIQREVGRLLEIQRRLECTDLAESDLWLDKALRQQLTNLGVTLNTLQLLHQNAIWDILPEFAWNFTQPLSLDFQYGGAD